MLKLLLVALLLLTVPVYATNRDIDNVWDQDAGGINQDLDNNGTWYE